jgi:hypothetical protein
MPETWDKKIRYFQLLKVAASMGRRSALRCRRRALRASHVALTARQRWCTLCCRTDRRHEYSPLNWRQHAGKLAVQPNFTLATRDGRLNLGHRRPTLRTFALLATLERKHGLKRFDCWCVYTFASTARCRAVFHSGRYHGQAGEAVRKE